MEIVAEITGRTEVFAATFGISAYCKPNIDNWGTFDRWDYLIDTGKQDRIRIFC